MPQIHPNDVPRHASPSAEDGRFTPVAPFDRVDLLVMSGLCLLWAAAAWLIRPAGEFPLNDDWAYVLPVKELLETGRLTFTNWQAMPLLTQVGYGALACLPGGYSITTLRLVTALLGLAGALGMYFLGRSLGHREWAAWAALLLLSNPLYVVASFTFLVDVPFVAFTLWALALAWRGVAGRGAAWLAAAACCALLAVFTRQLGIFIMPCVALLLLLRDGFSRTFWIWGVLPSILLVAALIGYQEALRASDNLPYGISESTASTRLLLNDLFAMRWGALRPAIVKTGVYLAYVGLGAATLVAAGLLAGWSATPRHGRPRALSAGLALLAGFIGYAAIFRFTMPWQRDMFWGAGFAPVTLANWSPPLDAVIGSTLILTPLSVLFGTGLALLGLSAAWRLVRAGRLPRPHPGLAAVALAMLYISPTMISYSMWSERYSIWITPLAIVALLGALPVRPSSAIRLLAGAQVGIGLTFSVAATHDYLEWNRVRWAAARSMLAEGIPLEQLDGGFEFNAYMGALADGVHRAWQRPREDARLRLATSIREGERALRSFPCRVWLPWSVREILLVETVKTPDNQ